MFCQLLKKTFTPTAAFCVYYLEQFWDFCFLLISRDFYQDPKIVSISSSDEKSIMLLFHLNWRHRCGRSRLFNTSASGLSDQALIADTKNAHFRISELRALSFSAVREAPRSHRSVHTREFASAFCCLAFALDNSILALEGISAVSSSLKKKKKKKKK